MKSYLIIGHTQRVRVGVESVLSHLMNAVEWAHCWRPWWMRGIMLKKRTENWSWEDAYIWVLGRGEKEKWRGLEKGRRRCSYNLGDKSFQDKEIFMFPLMTTERRSLEWTIVILKTFKRRLLLDFWTGSQKVQS